jgi:hypothetical protein
VREDWLEARVPSLSKEFTHIEEALSSCGPSGLKLRDQATRDLTHGHLSVGPTPRSAARAADANAIADLVSLSALFGRAFSHVASGKSLEALNTVMISTTRALLDRRFGMAGQ